MDYLLKDNAITLFCVGEINSFNALEKENEVLGVLKNQMFSNCVLDFSKLNYISSAGLRIILRLKQKYKNSK